MLDEAGAGRPGGAAVVPERGPPPGGRQRAAQPVVARGPREQKDIARGRLRDGPHVRLHGGEQGVDTEEYPQRLVEPLGALQ